MIRSRQIRFELFSFFSKFSDFRIFLISRIRFWELQSVEKFRDRDQDHELRMITRIRMRMRVRICLPAMIRPDRLILEGCTPAMLHIPRCCKYKPPWTLHIPIKYLSYILYVPFIYPSYTLVYTLHIPILYHLYTFHIHILYPLYTLHIPAPYPNIPFIHWWRIMVNISHFCRSTFPFVLFQNLMHISLSS